jgi:hypothetical protein
MVVFLMATSTVAVGQQRAAVGFPFASDIQVPMYGATAASDICLAVFLLDSTGRIQYVRYALLPAWQTATVATGKYVPVFAVYMPAASASYPIQRCMTPPASGTMITDPQFEPRMWVSLAPSQTPKLRVDVDQANIGAIELNAGSVFGNILQAVELIQVNYAKVSPTLVVGFGGIAEVNFKAANQLPLLLNRLSSCGSQYFVGNGYGHTCDPAQQP